MLKEEFQYYLDNQDELVKKFNNKYIVIRGKEVVGTYDTKEQAYEESVSKYQLGTFLIQFCLPGTSGYTQVFHSQVLLRN